MIVETAEKQFSLEITEDEQDRLISLVISHYSKHKAEYGLKVSSTDPFKFLAWAGIFLYSDIKKDSARKSKYLASAVSVMWKLLKKNGRNLDSKLIQKLTMMVKNHIDSDKNYLSTGKNGLYMAFRFASESEHIDIPTLTSH